MSFTCGNTSDKTSVKLGGFASKGCLLAWLEETTHAVKNPRDTNSNTTPPAYVVRPAHICGACMDP